MAAAQEDIELTLSHEETQIYTYRESSYSCEKTEG